MVSQNESILTIDGPQQDLLRLKTEDLAKGELSLARDIYDKLYQALAPHFPAAGLAAPQIGILKSLFIYSYDRDPKNLEAAVNPCFVPMSDERVEGWEGCLSVIICVWKLARVPRY